jgi:hypothetical protein
VGRADAFGGAGEACTPMCPAANPAGGALTRPLDWIGREWTGCCTVPFALVPCTPCAAVGVPIGRIGGYRSLQLQWVVYRGGLHRLVAVDPRRVVGQGAEIVARSASLPWAATLSHTRTP